MAWSEDSLHLWLLEREKPAVVQGSHLHDAAVLEALSGRAVTCVDQTVEGVHFRPDVDPARVGAKAVGRALSDLAAAGAEAVAITLAICASGEASEAWLRAAIEGAAAMAERHGAALVGGDLCAAPGPTHLVASAIGSLPGRKRPPGRDRARAGQLLVITGSVGGSALGRHLAPEPRLAAGRRLHEEGATAMMDVSDGLAWDLHRLARQAQVAIELDEVPIHDDAHRRSAATGRTALWHALHDGEDYELVATIPTAGWKRALPELGGEAPAPAAIGRVREGEGLWIRVDGEHARWDPRDGGWEHGGPRA